MGAKQGLRILHAKVDRVILYPIPGTGGHLLFEDRTLAELAQWRQMRPWSREAGGQLFARDDGDPVCIEATGPRPADRRRRFSFIPDRGAERSEISRMHARGLHFIGDWHTHPQDIPTPSSRDVQSISELFTRSGHRLTAMLLVIVGRLDPPMGIYVGMHNGIRLSQLAHQAVDEVTVAARRVATDASLSP